MVVGVLAVALSLSPVAEAEAGLSSLPFVLQEGKPPDTVSTSAAEAGLGATTSPAVSNAGSRLALLV